MYFTILITDALDFPPRRPAKYPGYRASLATKSLCGPTMTLTVAMVQSLCPGGDDPWPEYLRRLLRAEPTHGEPSRNPP